MDTVALAILTKAIETGDPLGIVLSLCSLVVFGLLLNGIRKEIRVLSSTMNERFSNHENRILKLETKP